MSEFITFGVGVVVGACGLGGFWFWLGHKKGLDAASTLISTATGVAYAAASHAASVVDNTVQAAKVG